MSFYNFCQLLEHQSRLVVRFLVKSRDASIPSFIDALQTHPHFQHYNGNQIKKAIYEIDGSRDSVGMVCEDDQDRIYGVMCYYLRERYVDMPLCVAITPEAANMLIEKALNKIT